MDDRAAQITLANFQQDMYRKFGSPSVSSAPQRHPTSLSSISAWLGTRSRHCRERLAFNRGCAAPWLEKMALRLTYWPW